MATYKLHILPAAQNDLREIVEYANTLSPQAALELYDAIINGIGMLAEMPLRCGLLKTPELRAKGYRALQVKNYTMFFVAEGNVMQIRRILYSKRQFAWLL